MISLGMLVITIGFNWICVCDRWRIELQTLRVWTSGASQVSVGCEVKLLVYEKYTLGQLY